MVRIEPYDLEAGPLGHLQAERERLADLTWQHFDATQVGATIGAELSGLDLRVDLGDDVIAEVRQALLDYKVLFFRDQHLTAEQHVAFARRFGDLEVHPFLRNHDQLPELAASLVRSKVDVILATALQPARAAAEATRTIPIVFVVAADPVAQRLAGGLGRPSGNVTGLAAYDVRESSERVFELLKATTPKLSRLGVMLVPGNPVHQELMAQPLPSAAQRAGPSTNSLPRKS